MIEIINNKLLQIKQYCFQFQYLDNHLVISVCPSVPVSLFLINLFIAALLNRLMNTKGMLTNKMQGKQLSLGQYTNKNYPHQLRFNLHSVSGVPSEQSASGSHSRSKLRKHNSNSLFKEAHRANGQTYLKPANTQSNISSPKAKKQCSSKVSTPSPLTSIKRYRSDSNFQIKQVVEINIASSGSDLTRLINRQIRPQQSLELSALMPPPADQTLLKKNSSTTESIKNILQCLK